MPNKVPFGNISVPALCMLVSFLYLNASGVIGISFRSSNMRVARMDSRHFFKITDNNSRLSMLINDPRNKLSLVQSCSQGIFKRATSIRGGNINCDDDDSQNDDCPDVCCDMPNQNQFDGASKPPKFALLFMDKFCNYHGGYLASKARDVYGVATIDVISSYIAGYMLRAVNDDMESNGQDEQSSILSMRLPSPDQLSQWKQKLPRGIQIIAAICESDSGLGEAELLGDAISVRYHNGYNEARRDKFLMNEVAAKHGLRTVQQKLCASLDEANAFATELGVGQSHPSLDYTSEEDCSDLKASSALSLSGTEDIRAENFNTGRLGGTTSSHHRLQKEDRSWKYCIIKPTRGVASDDVHFCSNLEQVKAAFEKIQGTSIFGSTSGERHNSVLVQEFAVGTEYAIDIISKNGEHKIATLWRYDKRQANGAPFVYFATEVVDAESKIGKIVCEYAMKALDALDIRYGLTHSEFIINENDEMERSLGPRLVEVNCRQHNTNFAPLAMAAIGYNALDMLLASLLGDLPGLPENTEHMRLPWDELPQLPQTRAFAAVVHLVCYEEGLLVAIRHDVLEEIGSLPSVYAMEIYDHFEVGGHIEKTIDIRSDSGWVHIINDDEEQFQHDYDRIVELMPLMFEVVRP